ncbi:MAG: trypsin-like peptidase domain-containing protein, partial [Acidobacteria bacterium]|nr:trypsin-like peptidase domain-containing protein [Acidobacteriota bacterium]
MYELPKDQMNDSERSILRKLRVWIVALGAACLVVGVGIGAILTGRPAVAQNDVASAARAPEALSASFAEIARRVEPAVVNIDTVTAAPEMAERGGGDDEDSKDDPATNNPLLDMLRRQARRPARGVGSGFIVDPKGYILTNQHVVQGATRITVRLQSGEEFRGVVKGIDEETDVAVVKIESGRDLPFVKLGNSDETEVGDWVLAIGSPFGLDQTVTAGIISKKERNAPPFSSFQQFLQTDAAINRGNSGGPLVNMRGEVIGINSQIATSTGDYNGIGFALPSKEAGFVYQQIISAGKVRRGYLGIFLDSVRPEFARVYELPDTKGAIVTDVRDAQGPAGKAGILANDIIVEYNGQPVLGDRDLINKVAGTTVGQTVALTYLREVNGKLERRTANVTIGERPTSLAQRDEDAPVAPPAKEKAPSEINRVRLGVTLQELTPQIANERKLTGVRGLYVKDIDPNGIIADARPRSLGEGDVILRINRIPTTTLEEFERIVNALKPGDAVVLNVASYSREAGRVVQRVVQFTYQ